MSISGPIVEERRGPRWDKPSVALIVCHTNGRGTIIEHHGPHIRQELDDMGVHGTFQNLNPRPGIWIWEGVLKSSVDYWGEYDAWLEGSLREPTEEEWSLIEEGELLWSEEDWWV